MYKEKLIDLLKTCDKVKEAMYDSFYKCDYNLQERFIRMYCRNKAKYFIVYGNGDISFKSNTVLLRLDDTKDFDNQDDEVYQKIYEVLYNLIK